MARIAGVSLSISTKTAGEVATFIRRKQIDNAIAYLEQVVIGKKAIPFKRRVKDIPHRKGMRTGRYPKRVSEQVIHLLKGLKSNAQDRGFDTSKMIIVHAVAQKGTIVSHYGRRRTERKNTHFEIIAKEVEKLKTKKKPAQPETKISAVPKETKKEEPKPETKPVAQPETKVSAAPPAMEKKIEEKKPEAKTQ